ncbi:MAG: hypothetical protein KKB79_00520 [Nanoarchaeota archaeon]|nr:hypothetical protein [Nanoarchaeota archaeon]
MDKKIFVILIIVGILVIGGIAYFFIYNQDSKKVGEGDGNSQTGEGNGNSPPASFYETGEGDDGSSNLPPASFYEVEDEEGDDGSSNLPPASFYD